MEKIIVVYYSRTGTTKKLAEKISKELKADIEEIQDTVNRSGIKGYLISGRDAMKRKLTKLKPLKVKLSAYDLVIIGTPIWGWNMSVPIRTFLEQNKKSIKKTAFFCTLGSSGDKQTFLEMGKILAKKPIATVALTAKTANSKEINISEFIKEVKNAI